MKAAARSIRQDESSACRYSTTKIATTSKVDEYVLLIVAKNLRDFYHDLSTV